MRYPSCLSDAEWNCLRGEFPKPSGKGRPREHPLRELLNACFYLLRTGCQWRQLPNDLPPWSTVAGYFYRWKRSGLLERIHTRLRERLRRQAGRQTQPSAGVLDSQTVKSTECSEDRGYDAGKKINGRKRHVVVDTLGLLLMVKVLPACVQDRDGARQLLEVELAHFKQLQLIWADGGYAGQLVHWVKERWQCALEIVKRSDDVKGFKVLPRRWVVERTFGWLGRSRRLNRDYERKADTGEALVYLAMTRLMLRRLSK